MSLFCRPNWKRCLRFTLLGLLIQGLTFLGLSLWLVLGLHVASYFLLAASSGLMLFTVIQIALTLKRSHYEQSSVLLIQLVILLVLYLTLIGILTWFSMQKSQKEEISYDRTILVFYGLASGTIIIILGLISLYFTCSALPTIERRSSHLATAYVSALIFVSAGCALLGLSIFLFIANKIGD